MFNVFDLGHALPLRFRRFSCCAPPRAIRRGCTMLCCIRRYDVASKPAGRVHSLSATHPLLEVLRHLLRVPLRKPLPRL